MSRLMQSAKAAGGDFHPAWHGGTGESLAGSYVLHFALNEMLRIRCAGCVGQLLLLGLLALDFETKKLHAAIHWSGGANLLDSAVIAQDLFCHSGCRPKTEHAG